jgi:deoxyribodipyrimidine photolyase
MKRGLVWFTEDLRVDDNETLLKAIEENDEIVPVFFLKSFADQPQFLYREEAWLAKNSSGIPC